MKIWQIVSALLVVIFFNGCCSSEAKEKKSERFPVKAFYLAFNNQNFERKRADLDALLERIAQAGYTHIFLEDWKFTAPYLYGAQYRENVRKMGKLIRQKNLKIIPGVTNLGDSCGYSAAFPHEVEALPVINAPYRVVNGQFVPENILQNGSFEQGLGNYIPDKSGGKITVDTQNAAAGKQSVHFEINSAQRKQLRLLLPLEVKPFQHYRITFKMKTRNLQGPGKLKGLGVAVLGNDPAFDAESRHLSYRKIVGAPIQSSGDWQKYTLTFNTLEYRKIEIYWGCWGSQSGEFWVDDIEMKPAGFINIVRRKDTPVVVKSVDKKQTFLENKDFTAIRDKQLGNFKRPRMFGDTQEPVTVKVTKNSQITDNQVVLVSYYHAAIARRGANFCLNSSLLPTIINRQIDWLNSVLQPDGFFIGIDEQRAWGYDPACEKSQMSAGDAFRKWAIFSHQKIRKVLPNAEIFMWNDMFDPASGNCYKRYYYLMKGKESRWNSWIGLPQDIKIMLWTGDHPDRLNRSLAHWRSLGHQIVCFPGYFDDKIFPAKTRGLLEILKKEPLCIGVAFAQWGNIYNNQHLEKLMDEVKSVQ